MAQLVLPPEVEAVIKEFRTCELSTLAKDGTPITWPTLPFWDPRSGLFVVTTSIALDQKVRNVRRNGKIALLFSNPAASGLREPPALLVQGDATADDQVSTSVAGYEEALAEVYRRQPSSAIYASNPITRYLFDWYYMRLTIVVTPRRFLWWPRGDFTARPRELTVQHEEASYVA